MSINMTFDAACAANVNKYVPFGASTTEDKATFDEVESLKIVSVVTPLSGEKSADTTPVITFFEVDPKISNKSIEIVVVVGATPGVSLATTSIGWSPYQLIVAYLLSSAALNSRH